jgi:hypothetical protein
MEAIDMNNDLFVEELCGGRCSAVISWQKGMEWLYCIPRIESFGYFRRSVEAKKQIKK